MLRQIRRLGRLCLRLGDGPNCASGRSSQRSEVPKYSDIYYSAVSAVEVGDGLLIPERHATVSALLPCCNSLPCSQEVLRRISHFRTPGPIL